MSNLPGISGQSFKIKLDRDWIATPDQWEDFVFNIGRDKILTPNDKKYLNQQAKNWLHLHNKTLDELPIELAYVIIGMLNNETVTLGQNFANTVKNQIDVIENKSWK